MSAIVEILRQPWPWYAAGTLMGLAVPVLLLMGNRSLGVSSSLRDLCATVLPGRPGPGSDDGKEEGSWNLFFALGIVIGGVIAGWLLRDPMPVDVSQRTVRDLQALGISDRSGFLPREVFDWSALGSLRGLVVVVAGAFLVGFGARYSGGCTSGHGIMGLSSLQWPSLAATLAIFAGVILSSFFLLPLVLRI